MVLFILVYFAAAASAKLTHLELAGSTIEMTPNNTVQYLQFDNISYNLTDFTICTWLKFSNFSHTQTIFRLSGNKKETVILWRMHVHPKETMRVTVKNKLIMSEGTQLAKGQWNHVCYQWKGSTGVWAMFVNAKIHSVGQIPAVGNETASWKLNGKGVGTLGDDNGPCRNGLQAYGLYMIESTATTTTTTTAAADKAGGGGESKTAKKPSSKNGGGGKTTKSRRQAVFDDLDDPTTTGSGGTGNAAAKPFQWFTKTFAFVKRMFTFVIIPFFKFVRNTFFQTRSVDDTVVDVSETHLTVSDVKFAPSPPSSTAAADKLSDDNDNNNNNNVNNSDSDSDNNNNNNKRRSSSAKRETDGSGGGGGAQCDDDANDGRVSATDLTAAAAATADDSLSPNVKRYLRMVSDGLNDVGVNVAFVKRTFACCPRPVRPRATTDRVIVDWDRTGARAHGVIVAPAVPHACGRF